jgi:putative ABC transport system ATP-binding protein
MVSVTNLRKSYPGVTRRSVLNGISFDLAPGEWVAILGESGSGKSTLLNLIAGLEPPDEGRIVVAGRDLGTLDDDARTLLRREKIGFVFQAFHVLPYLTVARNVALPLALNGWPPAQWDGRVAEVLAAVGLGDRASSQPRELSGGELQRVAIARALAHRPALVLADEPTGNLDEDTRDEIIVLLETMWRERGLTMVFVTHDSTVARRAQRIGVMKNGRLGFKQSRLGPAPRVQAEPAQVPERSGLQPPDLPDLSDLEDDDSEPADTITFD